MEHLKSKGLRRKQRNDIKNIMKVAASEMKELEEEDVRSKMKMSKIQEVFYKSLELKREAPTTTRPMAMKIKE